MHGPTFMANALACAVAVASVELLLGRDWRARVREIEAGLRDGLAAGRRPCPAWPTCGCSARSASSRWTEPVDLRIATPRPLEHGVWLRPFRNLIYAMPPYICTPRGDRADHLGDGRRRPCTNLNGVQLPAPPTCSSPGRSAVTRVGLSPLAWLDDVEQQRRAAGLRRSLRARPPVGAELDLASNDYLGLSQHPDVIDGGVDALRTWGAGSTGSRLVTGNTELHEDFEDRAGRISSAPSRRWCSRRATPPTSARWSSLSGPGSLLVSDALTHASLVDACRLSRARVVVTPHRDVAAVEAALAARDEDARCRGDRLGVLRRRRARAAARPARRVPTARRAAARRRGARARRAR